MATHIQTFKLSVLRISLVYELDESIEKLMPRRPMVNALGVILAGLSIPALMAIQLIPVNLLLGFVSLALIATGGIMALIFSGEI